MAVRDKFYNGPDWRLHVQSTGGNGNGGIETPQLIDPNGNVILGMVAGSTAAVNYPQLTNGATGTPAIVGAAGTDTNVSYQVNSKGTGVLIQNAPVCPVAAVTVLGAVGATVLTPAQTLTGFITHNPTGAVADTFPTAALLVAACPGAPVNTRIYVDISNLHATNVITATAGSGGAFTAGATATIAGVSTRFFVIVLTNVTPASEAYVIYSLGVGLN